MSKRRLKLWISAAYYPVCRCRSKAHRLARRRTRGDFVVLTYHHLRREDRAAFARQMDELKRLSEPVRADFSDPLESGRCYAALTFDDGYRSFLDWALPELEQRRIPATIFVPTGCLGRSGSRTDGDRGAFQKISVMTADEIRGLPRDLVAVGSHSVHHPRLSTLPDAEVERELAESKAELEGILGSDVTMFAFPHGDFDRRVADLAKRAGYNRVFATVPNFHRNRPGDFLFGRIDTRPTDETFEFRLKLLGAYQWLPTAIRVKRRLKRLVRFPRPVRPEGKNELAREKG